MTIGQRLALQFRDFVYGDNWTAINLKTQLEDVTWQQANQQVDYFNTIVGLTYHIFYYIQGQNRVLQGQELQLSDSLSFLHPAIESEADWNAFKQEFVKLVEEFALRLEQVPDSEMDKTFVQEDYGSLFRNLVGVLEHGYYHLGQIVLIKKMVQS